MTCAVNRALGLLIHPVSQDRHPLRFSPVTKDAPADFETDDPYIIVDLDEVCRRQQVGEGWYADITEVPQRSISMSIRQMLKAKELIAIVPGKNKAEAVELCFDGSVSPMAPASILRTHPRATVYLDRDSAPRLDNRLIDESISISTLRDSLEENS